jgi:hypothetical protein
MKHALDVFCLSLWNLHVEQSVEVEEVTGKEAVPPEMAIDPYCPMEAGCILFGPRGMGKSATLLTMAVQLDSGMPGVFTIPYRRPVLFINLERSKESLRSRLGRINTALGLAYDRPLRMINARGRSLTDVAEKARAIVQNGSADVVMLDSLSRAGVELTKDDHANNAIDILNSFGTWITIAHEPKNRTAKDASVFGSSMFENAADVVMRLSSQQMRDQNELGIALRVTKANDIRFPLPMCFAVGFDELGVTHVRSATLSEFSELSGGRSGGSVADDLVSYLLENGKATMTEAAEELDVGRTWLQKIAKSDQRIVRLPKEGRKQFYAVKTERGDWVQEKYA